MHWDCWALEILISMVFATKLSEVVTSLFQANGELRSVRDYFKLMQWLACFSSHRTIHKLDTVIIDDVAML